MKFFGWTITISKRDYVKEAEYNLQMRRGVEAVLFRPEVFTSFLASKNTNRRFHGKKRGRR